jgi:hypothetical protein
MQPRMSEKEVELFLDFVKCASVYVEFGAGGSTVAASKHVKSRVVSLDSSVEWLDKVRKTCSDNNYNIPELHFIDLGPTGNWGFPTQKDCQDKWPAYHESIWSIDGAGDADLYMVDGRFRVACFAQTVLHCRSDAVICFHDFKSRPHYHAVMEIARQIVTVEDISFFVPMPGKRDLTKSILDTHRFDAR